MRASNTGAFIILGILIVYFLCRLIRNRIRTESLSYSRGKDQYLREQIADSLEESAPIHLDVGSGFESGLAGGSALAAAETTETVSAQMAYADEPWLITGSGGFVTALEKDAVQTGMKAADYGNSYDPDLAVYSGASAVEHASGNAVCQEMKPSALHLSLGSFGSTGALLDTLCDHGEALCVGGDDLVSQAVGTVTADAVFVGEQVFEIPDTLDRKEKKNPALMTMDVVRWVLIVVVVVFAAAGLTGI